MRKKGIVFILDMFIAIGIFFFFVMLYFNSSLDYTIPANDQLFRISNEIVQVLELSGLFSHSIQENSAGSIEDVLNTKTPVQLCFNIDIFNQSNVLELTASKNNCGERSDTVSVSFGTFIHNFDTYYYKVEVWVR